MPQSKSFYLFRAVIVKKLIPLVFLLCSINTFSAGFESELHDFKAEILSGSLEKPWSLAFLPGGEFLVTEHAGNLVRVDATGARHEVSGLPLISPSGQGGLLDVRLDPDFADNQRIFLCYTAGGFIGYYTELASARLQDDRLTQVEILLESQPRNTGGRHFGCRIEFDLDKRLYLSIGDRGDRPNAQDLSNHAGSVLRLERDGSVPADNPFVNGSGSQPQLFSYGNRNPQGMARHPESGEIWAHEHGPQGGDELNIIRKGVNYGWPVITYGVNYGLGTSIGEGTHKQGMAQPEYYWVPSIAPSGMSFYRGDAFPRWNNSLFVGSLKFRLLVRLEMQGDTVVSEERLLEDEFGRIRDVRTGPDGLLYLLTDANPGKLIRLRPLE